MEREFGAKIANASATSQHNHCEAVDFVVDGTLQNTEQLYRFIKDNKIKDLKHNYISQVILERKKRANSRI